MGSRRPRVWSTQRVGLSRSNWPPRRARAAGLDDIVLMPTTADANEIDRARDVLGI